MKNKKETKKQSVLTRKLYFPRLSIKDQTIFAKRLSLLVKAGVPILEGLRMLKTAKSSTKNIILDSVISDVEAGNYLHTSLGKFKNIFGDFAINIIKVGEAGGILDQNLNYLAEELKKKHELRRKIISSLVYPVFIMLATLGVSGMLLIFVLPKILPVFESLSMQLPITTRILIGTSNFLIHYGLYLLAGLFLLAVLVWALKKYSDRVCLALDKMMIKIPLLGRVAMGYQMTNFCRTLGLLLRSGIKINDAVSITADTTENFAYKMEYKKLADSVSKGKRISVYLEKKPKMFPEIMAQMVAIGENTGDLSDTLLYLSEMYENEVDDMTKNLSSALEPVLMIFMGIIVGFMAVSIITPIYEITQNLSTAR